MGVANRRIFSIVFQRGELRPDQVQGANALEDVKIDAITSKEDSRFDKMSEAQRDAYYVHPNLVTRFVKFFRGR